MNTCTIFNLTVNNLGKYLPRLPLHYTYSLVGLFLLHANDINSAVHTQTEQICTSMEEQASSSPDQMTACWREQLSIPGRIPLECETVYQRWEQTRSKKKNSQMPITKNRILHVRRELNSKLWVLTFSFQQCIRVKSYTSKKQKVLLYLSHHYKQVYILRPKCCILTSLSLQEKSFFFFPGAQFTGRPAASIPERNVKPASFTDLL